MDKEETVVTIIYGLLVSFLIAMVLFFVSKGEDAPVFHKDEVQVELETTIIEKKDEDTYYSGWNGFSMASHTEESYYFVVELPNGTKKEIDVDYSDYTRYEVGDTYITKIWVKKG